MDIYFDNGEKMNIELTNNFHAGMESRVIDLPRVALSFLHSTIGQSNGSARVTVWSKR